MDYTKAKARRIDAHHNARAQTDNPTKPVHAAMASVANTDALALRFPRCDAAVQKMNSGEWELADAIVDECSETGEDGVRNGSNDKMEAMRLEIGKNRDVDLSLERIRKLRKVASNFPASRRRPGVSLEAHLEAVTPDALDAFAKSAPKGTPLTREFIRRQKRPVEKTEQEQPKAERRRQGEDHRQALQSLCRQLEKEKEEREQRYIELCRTVGKDPEPFSPPLVPADQPLLSPVEDLERSTRELLLSRGFDPAANKIKQAIADFVTAVLAQ
jgi:hypothetical protein